MPNKHICIVYIFNWSNQMYQPKSESSMLFHTEKKIRMICRLINVRTSIILPTRIQRSIDFFRSQWTEILNDLKWWYDLISPVRFQFDVNGNLIVKFKHTHTKNVIYCCTSNGWGACAADPICAVTRVRLF